MPDVVVRGEGISKRYRIGEYRAGYETLRDTLAHGMRLILGRERRHPYEEIWALEDVSFEIEQGEVVGFIGRNGAGKSTLLKILTRITLPTRGRAEIRGRVGSILEVGTGFHPELTGRENIFLNGAVLGMKRREITAKLPQIVEFSGVEKFMDTPIKRYSSGMYVRLAFAVAAHLDPEVLLVDEVLAVGDHEFQQRCMGRIEDISSSGRTVIFVSHDMQAIARLCHRAYQLDSGRVVNSGPSEEVVSQYLQAVSGRTSGFTWDDLETAPGNDLVRLRSARIVDADGKTVNAIDVRKPVGVEIGFRALRHGEPVFPRIKLTDSRGQVAFNAMDIDRRWLKPTEPGDYIATAWIPANLLNEGVFTVDLGLASLAAPRLKNQINMGSLLSFQVQDPGVGDSSKGLFTGQLRGAIRPMLDWSLEKAD
jgi:lipopolysaccharide transport system ATP-binding protein